MDEKETNTHIIFRLNREIGTLTTKLESQSKEIESLKKELKDNNEKIDHLISILEAGKVSWKTVTIIGSVVTAITTSLVYVYNVLSPFIK